MSVIVAQDSMAEKEKWPMQAVTLVGYTTVRPNDTR
jgi:hypothetical protein